MLLNTFLVLLENVLLTFLCLMTVFLMELLVWLKLVLMLDLDIGRHKVYYRMLFYVDMV